MLIRRWLIPLTGLILIVTSVMGLVWWERQGRELLLMEPVAVAAHHISAGTEIKGSEFRQLRVDVAALMSGSIKPAELPGLAGKIASRDIPKGAQVSQADFKVKNSALSRTQSLYRIKEEWIDNRSAALRQGDRVSIYDEEGMELIGSFLILHVRDESEQEIVDGELNVSSDIGERNFSSNVVSSVEILCGIEDYQKIYRITELEGGKLLLVQKEGEI